MPRSRSMSIRSRYCARAARSSTTPVSCSIRSASVDLPWSMWAMMQKLRMIAGSVWPGCGAFSLGTDVSRVMYGGRRPFSHRRTPGARAPRTPSPTAPSDDRVTAPYDPDDHPARPDRAPARVGAPAAARAGARRGAVRLAGRRRPTRRARGFTPGFASVLACEDGSRHFVKAASHEGAADVRRGLPRGGAQARGPARRARPAPRLLWIARATTGWCSASSTSRPARRAGRGRPPTCEACAGDGSSGWPRR